MKNKNIKNKPQKCGRWLFLHSRFSKLFPLIKGIHHLKPSKSFFNNNSSQRQKKEPESPPPLKQSTKNLSSGYTEIEKKRRALGQDLFSWGAQHPPKKKAPL